MHVCDTMREISLDYEIAQIKLANLSEQERDQLSSELQRVKCAMKRLNSMINLVELLSDPYHEIRGGYPQTKDVDMLFEKPDDMISAVNILNKSDMKPHPTLNLISSSDIDSRIDEFVRYLKSLK
jgi:hypothetical protein